jgi:hypothetical protein
MPSTIERQTLINPEFISAESPSSIIRKVIVTQQIEQENAIEKMEVFSRPSAKTRNHLSPVFFFIENNDLENLEKIITEYPEILNQKYESILTPV